MSLNPIMYIMRIFMPKYIRLQVTNDIEEIMQQLHELHPSADAKVSLIKTIASDAEKRNILMQVNTITQYYTPSIYWVHEREYIAKGFEPIKMKYDYDVAVVSTDEPEEMEYDMEPM